MGSNSPGILQNALTALVLGVAVLAAAGAGFGFSRAADVEDTRQQAAVDAPEARAVALLEAQALRLPRDVERDHWTRRKAGPEAPIRRRRQVARPAPRLVVDAAEIGEESAAGPAAAALPAPPAEQPPVSAEPVRVALPRVDWGWAWLRHAPGPVVANDDDARTRFALSVGERLSERTAAALTPAPAPVSTKPAAVSVPTATGAVPTTWVASISSAATPLGALPARSDALPSAAALSFAPVATALPKPAPALPVVAESVPVASALRPAAPVAVPPPPGRPVPAAPSALPAAMPAPVPPVAGKPAPGAPVPSFGAPAALPPTSRPVVPDAPPPHPVVAAAPPPAPNPVAPAAPPPVVAQTLPSHAGVPDFVLSKARDLEDLHLPTVGGIHVGASGALGGSGAVPGSLVVAGVFAPGHSPGLVEVGGDFALESDAVLEIELAGTDPEDFDRILVEGTATLSGVVRVLLLDGFVPGLGDTFEVILAQAIQDTGATFALPDLGPDLLLQLSTATTDTGQALVLSSVTLVGGAGALVPEPGPALLLASVLAAVALRRRVSR